MTRRAVDHPEAGDLLQLLDGELSEPDRARLRRHLDDCSACRREFDLISQTSDAFVALRDEEIRARLPLHRVEWADLRPLMRAYRPPRPARPSAPRWRRWGIAAALLAGAALAMVGVMRWGRRPSTAPPREPAPARRPAPVERPVTPPIPVIRPAFPAAAGSRAGVEVRVLAALHRIGADLDDPIEVDSGARGPVEVTALSLPETRQAEVRQALADLPDVRLRFSDAHSAGPLSGPSGAAAARPAPGPFDARIEQRLGSRQAADAFCNRVLDESDAMMARAQAVHNLQVRFPPARRAELLEAERGLLDEMLASHRAAFSQHARSLIALLGEVRQALGAEPAVDAGPAPSDPLAAARRMDRIVTLVFGGAASQRPAPELAAELAAASAELQSAVGARP